MKWKLWVLGALVTAALTGCNDDDSSDSTQASRAPVPTPTNSSTLRIGLLPDTQGGNESVAMHPMRAVLEQLQAMGTDIVIPVGDLVDNGTTREFEQWTRIASEFRDDGIEFLPLMGNHEDSYAYTVEWIENMKDYIPEDAVHMSGAEYVDYYVIRDNVLIIALRYYHLPIAFQWVKQVINEHRDDVDHIVIASHDGLIGAKYGEAREQIVEGVEGDNKLINQWEDIRDFFSRHDVIWVQGHEHMYQRSVVRAPVGVTPESWSRNDRNYRLPQYTQIMSGNASYKGYEFRYGERELVQSIVSQKVNTMDNGSTGYDANAGMLTFTGPRVDYVNYFAEHTIGSNEDGPKELADAQWTLLDRFSRTNDRCERIVYPNSIPAATRPVLVLNPSYRSNECFASDGSVARMLDGTNDTFNRIESRTRSMEFTPGYSRADSQTSLMRLGYQFLFQIHERWSPNLNGNNRLVPSASEESEVLIPETTIDLKEHVTLSWLKADDGTVSDVLIVSGTQNQTGTYSSAYGQQKNIETDIGLPNSQPDGSAKQPVALPDTASRSWDLATAVSDAYVLQFDAPEGVDAQALTLGMKNAEGNWVAVAGSDCVVAQSYSSQWLDQAPQRSAECDDAPLVGYDANYGGRWWAVLDHDAELALINK